MANVSVYNMQGQEVGTIDLNDAVFGAPVNENLLHMAVVQLETEGHRPRKTGFHESSSVDRRRRSIRSRSA